MILYFHMPNKPPKIFEAMEKHSHSCSACSSLVDTTSYIWYLSVLVNLRLVLVADATAHGGGGSACSLGYIALQAYVEAGAGTRSIACPEWAVAPMLEPARAVSPALPLTIRAGGW
jgi:hypothetical protein